MSNKCDPKLNIQIPENLISGLNLLSQIAQNRPLTTKDVLDVFSRDDLQQLAQQPNSRAANQPQAQPSQIPQQSRAAGAGGGGAGGSGAGGGGAGGGGASLQKCNPDNKKIGAWNTPITTYGNILGIPIEPRELNCNCGGEQ